MANLYKHGESKDYVLDYKGNVIKKDSNVIKIKGTYYPKDAEDVKIIDVYNYGYSIFNDFEHVLIDDVYYHKSECFNIITEIENGLPVIESFRNSDLIIKIFGVRPKELPLVRNIHKLFKSTRNLKVRILSSKIADELGFTYYSLDSSFYYDPKGEVVEANKRMKGKYIPYTKFSNLKSKLSTKKEKYKYGTDSPTYLISEGLPYTFGVELETSSGNVPRWMAIENNLNIACERDGSIKGGEFITGVLKGDQGFNQLYRTTKILSKHCTIDKSCGIHVHIGGTIFNKEFSIYSYILGEKLQNDVFSILPSSRQKNMYCSRLPNYNLQKMIDKYGYDLGHEKAYEYLFKKLSIDKSYGRGLNSGMNKAHQHPGGRYCGRYNGQNMEDLLRYCWLNLITCNFNTRKSRVPTKPNGRIKNGPVLENTSYTIEFRNHSASLNYEKIKNWVLICMAFVSYVNNNKRDILSKDSITLEDIVSSVYSKRAPKLLKYIKERRSKFALATADTENEEYQEEDNDKDLKLTQLVCA